VKKSVFHHSKLNTLHKVNIENLDTMRIKYDMIQKEQYLKDIDWILILSLGLGLAMLLFCTFQIFLSKEIILPLNKDGFYFPYQRV